MTEWLRFGLAALFLTAGAVVAICSVFGVFKFRFIMNRMHCAALLDSMALFLILIGLAFAAGELQYVPKLLLVLAVQWIGSPIAAHMVGRLEVDTNKNAEQFMKIHMEAKGEALEEDAPGEWEEELEPGTAEPDRKEEPDRQEMPETPAEKVPKEGGRDGLH